MGRLAAMPADDDFVADRADSPRRTSAVVPYGAGDAVYAIGLDGIVKSWNAAAQRSNGYRAADIIGQPCSVLYMDDDVRAGIPDRSLEQARTAGRCATAGWQQREDGTRWWARLSIDALCNPSGDVVEFITTSHAVSPSAVLTHATHDDRAIGQLLVDSLTDYAIYLLDLDGIVKSWNPGAQRIKGYHADEIIGSNYQVFFSEADIRSGEPGRGLAIARTTGRFATEGWRVRKDGTLFWAGVVVDAVRDLAGELVGFAKITRDRTQSMVERAALDELQAKSRLFLEAAPNGMLLVDSDGIITLANTRAEAIFGYPPGGLLEISVDALVPDGVREGHAANRTSFADESRPRAMADQRQLKGRRLDGSYIPIEILLNPVTTRSGRVVIASVIDITERTRTEAMLRTTASELRENNRLMSMTEEMAHYGHWRIDLLTNDVTWSAEVCRIHGLPTTHKPTIEAGIAAYDPNGLDVGAIVRQASLDGKPFAYESRILRPDGTLRDVRCLGRPEFSAAGSLIELVGIFQDITERKDAERVRDQLIERVSVATKNGKIGYWEYDPATDALTWDASMFALYGLTAASVLPSIAGWQRCLHEGDRERVGAEYAAALAGTRTFDTEFRIVWPGDDVRSIRAQATVLRNDAGQTVRMVGINWDITEVRGLAEQMREDQERLRVSERDRLFEHARRWSTSFQRAVLPPALPEVAGCAFDAVYEPGSGDAQVGGDWYDAVHLPDGRIFVSIGDVSGSGLQAAVVVGVVRQIMRGISQLHANPMLILDTADRALCLEYPGIYVSAWVGLIDLVTRSITYASAGHPPPLLVSSDGTVRELADTTTTLIGLRKGHRGQASTVRIAQGDALVLYTDGITEAGHDLVAGTQALHAAASAFAGGPAAHPAWSITRQVIPAGSNDDVAILVVRTDGVAADRFIERWTFDVGNGDAACSARHAFCASLAAYGFTSDACANAEVVFGELIGNVVRHANHAGNIDVAVNHAGHDSVLHVMDGGAGFNHISRLPRDPYAETGRGLFMIAALTQEFTVSERPDGGSHARAVLTR